MGRKMRGIPEAPKESINPQGRTLFPCLWFLALAVTSAMSKLNLTAAITQLCLCSLCTEQGSFTLLIISFLLPEFHKVSTHPCHKEKKRRKQNRFLHCWWHSSIQWSDPVWLAVQALEILSAGSTVQSSQNVTGNQNPKLLYWEQKENTSQSMRNRLTNVNTFHGKLFLCLSCSRWCFSVHICGTPSGHCCCGCYWDRVLFVDRIPILPLFVTAMTRGYETNTALPADTLLK